VSSLGGSHGLIALENGTEYYNVDGGELVETYNVTSTFLKIDFLSNCGISKVNFTGKIILVIWDEEFKWLQSVGECARSN